MPNVSTETQEPANPAYLYAVAFVDELQRAGLQNVVICPGSRSTPLAMAFAAQSAIRTWVHVDERSAAFFGLGMAKQSRQPVALLCTSGTAAANFLPALVEATLSHVPLLVLTADRPHELRDNGAPQSIDQNRLYGSFAKWFGEVALPEATDAAFRYIRTIADRAVAAAQAIPAGPVHLNFPFREPLTPEPIPEQSLPPVEQRDRIAWQGRPGNAPYTDVHDAPLGAPENETIGNLWHLISKAQRGLIIVGPIDDPTLIEPLLELAQHLGYPILADPLSQLRCGVNNRSMVLTSYDAFLRSDSFVESAQPELIIRFGAMPTSKPVLLYLKHYTNLPIVVIDGNGGWEEPTQLASQLIHANPTAFCYELLNALKQRQITEVEFHQPSSVDLERDQNSASAPTIPVPTIGYQTPKRWRNLSQAWLSLWQNTDTITQQALQNAIYDFKEIFEGGVFSELTHLLQDGTILYVGNSMPVRDLDTFFWSSKQYIRIMGNRGANGIDGVISSALGASAVAGHHEPVVLVLGDLSFFHDLNGLLAAHLHRLNLTIILINNDGGGIFSFLPQAAYPEHFEQLFGTPTGLEFRLVVEMYGGRYQRAENWESFRKAVNQGIHSSGLDVIEILAERTSNVKMHRQLWEVVQKAIVEQH
jgi:2-succinyl-5-enolpyruvyl-6-hydroxy-3-cyclohexene-1-carboxylate synthase